MQKYVKFIFSIAHDGWDCYSSPLPPLPRVSGEPATELSGCLMLFRCGSCKASRSGRALVALESVGPYLSPKPRDWGSRFQAAVSPPNQRWCCRGGKQFVLPGLNKCLFSGLASGGLGDFRKLSPPLPALTRAVGEAHLIHLWFKQDRRVLMLCLVDTVHTLFTPCPHTHSYPPHTLPQPLLAGK